MTDGIALDVTEFQVDASGRGHLTVNCKNRADFKAAQARLHPGTTVFDNRGVAHQLQLAGPPMDDPAEYPCTVALQVTESPVEPDDPKRRALLSNNLLQTGAWVNVIHFDPPSPDSDQPGSLRVLCHNQGQYDRLIALLDEPHGSAFSEADGSGRQWYIQRVEGGATANEPFPRRITFQVKWLRLD